MTSGGFPSKQSRHCRTSGDVLPDSYYGTQDPHLGKTPDASLSLSTLNRVSDTECHHGCMEVSGLGPTWYVCVLHPKGVVPSVTVLPSRSRG